MVEFTFDRQKFMQNLQAAMEQAGLKANELEQKAGVYAGYISRLKGEDTKLPGLDVVWKMSKILGVSLGRLIEGTFGKYTENLAYLEQFIKELFQRTTAKELDWRPVHLSDIATMMDSSLIRTENAIPFLETVLPSDYSVIPNQHENTPFGGSEIKRGHNRVYSFANPSGENWLNGACFFTDFGNGKILYLARICGTAMPWEVVEEDLSDDPNGVGRWYEFVVKYKSGKDIIATMLCNTFDQGDQLAYAARELYEELCKHEWDLRIEDNVRNLIDGFMNRGNTATTANTP